MKIGNQHSGFTLVELMVSITLGLILIFGVIEVYVGSKETYRTREAFSQMQEDARFVLESISRDIRMAGFVGCKNLASTGFTLENAATLNYTQLGVISGNNSNGASGHTPTTLPSGVSGPISFTDVISIQGAGRCEATLSSDMASNSADIVVSTANCQFEASQTLLISDCSSGEIFDIDSVNASGSNFTISHSGIDRPYLTENRTELFSMYSHSYFIGDDNGIPSLFIVDHLNDATPRSLVRGVENIQFEYLLDNNGDNRVDVVQDAAVSTLWNQVIAVKISLLMRSIESIDAPAHPFNFPSSNTVVNTYAAGPVRKEYTTTVKIRNRAI